MTDTQPAKPVYEPIPSELLTSMQRLRTQLGELISSEFPGKSLTGTPGDFTLLQDVVDAQILADSDIKAWEAMGIVFGDALSIEIPGLSWVQVTDEYGVDPVLRYQETTVQIGVATMLLKRVEQGEEINIKHMVHWLQAFIETRAHEYQ
ncbi:DUF3806 domain-containing protein [Pseudomonas purpurea]|uniref:DUF3806 domain-containing protein n=1 Tax=Pseudomonas purpurea TaxID=3136737 RepID=UPI0032634A72